MKYSVYIIDWTLVFEQKKSLRKHKCNGLSTYEVVQNNCWIAEIGLAQLSIFSESLLN